MSPASLHASLHASPDNARFAIRRMSQADLGTALDWAAVEGWNPGLDDARCFFAADPDGFFMGTWDGEPIGCISAVAYDNAFGFIGLYIVRQEWRGKGLGMRLWNEAMAYLGERNVGLDGVIAQQANYRKSGFVLAYRNVRYQGVAADCVKPLADMTFMDASSVPFERLLAYDTRCFISVRKAFLRAWLAQEHARAFAALDGDEVRGYGVIRRCLRGYKIGPLFADDLPIARALYQRLVSSVEGDTVFLDVPESNASAVALAIEHEMTSVFETARMYTRAPLAAPLDHVFGVTTFELG